GVQAEESKSAGGIAQGQKHGTAVAVLRCDLMPVKVVGRAGDVVADAHFAAADGLAGRAAAGWLGLVPGELDARQVSLLLTRMSHGHDAAGSVVHGVADPGHAVA